MAIPTLDQYTITALAQIFRDAKSAKEFTNALEELERRDKMFTAQRDALQEVYGWITTLNVNAFGTSYTDDQQPYSIRDKILHNLAEVLGREGDA